MSALDPSSVIKYLDLNPSLAKTYSVKLLWWNMRLLIFGCFQWTNMATAYASIRASALILFTALRNVGDAVSMSGEWEAVRLCSRQLEFRYQGQVVFEP